ncbi:GntR family transcriptional regulator [Hydrogenispora ethanolica]|jgi:GntR family transcriptional regulator|uniref:GntR family transcriptional regulator n=1 Tax=Hydrogenispora ethanolica TaxID=1082276 RepID=A0A4R1S4D5_HYDET|nr:GntR family transcriptional regulator [Hydrogenispora ethanolica]TCL74096.1 GntR family transcriptional regulator [Hydrogenispora ethanolica]
MFINKQSHIPVYYQLKKSLLEQIHSGQFDGGRPIPSERELSEKLNISRMTVRQAINQLVNEGVLYREKGRGTFVSKAKMEQRNVMSFSDFVRQSGRTPATRVLHFGREIAPPEVAAALELDGAAAVFNLKRLRLADQTPIAIEQVFLPERLFPELDRHDLTASLYQLIKDEYSYVIHFIDNSIEAGRPGKEEKAVLHLGPGEPLLRISGLYFSVSGQKLFYENSVYSATQYRYSVRIHVKENR